jgi:hypothetical protein
MKLLTIGAFALVAAGSCVGMDMDSTLRELHAYNVSRIESLPPHIHLSALQTALFNFSKRISTYIRDNAPEDVTPHTIIDALPITEERNLLHGITAISDKLGLALQAIKETPIEEEGPLLQELEDCQTHLEIIESNASSLRDKTAAAESSFLAVTKVQLKIAYCDPEQVNPLCNIKNKVRALLADATDEAKKNYVDSAVIINTFYDSLTMEAVKVLNSSDLIGRLNAEQTKELSKSIKEQNMKTVSLLLEGSLSNPVITYEKLVDHVSDFVFDTAISVLTSSDILPQEDAPQLKSSWKQQLYPRGDEGAADSGESGGAGASAE